MSSIRRESKLVAKHSTVYAVGTMLRQSVALVLLPLYTSYLTPADYGVKELIGLSMDIAGVLLATAVSSSLYRFYFDSDDPHRRNLVMSTAVLALGGFGLLGMLVLMPLTGSLAGMILDDPGLSGYLIISLGTLWFQTINQISYAWLRAHQRSVQYVAVSLVNFVVSIGLNIYFIVSLNLGVMGILLSTLLTSAIAFLFLTVPLLVKIRLKFDRKILGEMLAYGWPNIVSSLAAMVVKMADRFFLKAYFGIAEAGIYSLGCRFAAVPNQFISEPFNQTWMPRRFEIAKEPNSETTFGRIFTYYLCLIAFAGLIVSGLTADLIKLMATSQFWSAAAVVPVLVLANIVYTFHFHFNIGLLLEKKTKYIAVVNLTNVVLVLAFYWLLIPRYGAMGAAVASLIAYAFKAIMTFVLGRRFYPIHFEARRALKLLVVSAIVYFGVRFLSFESTFLSLTVKGIAIVVAYPLLLQAMRFFSPDEIRKLREIVGNRLGPIMKWLRRR